MIAFPFVCAPRSKKNPIIKGTFTQQDDHSVTIVTNDGGLIQRKLSSAISSPLNYIAHLNSELYPDLYKKVTNLNSDDSVLIRTLAQKMKDADKAFKETTKKVFIAPSGVHFTPEMAETLIKDANGDDISLYDLIGDVKSVFVPIDGKYTKVLLMNTILSSNFVSYDVDRQIVKNLQVGLIKINKHFSENDSDHISVIVNNSKNTSKGNCVIVSDDKKPCSRSIKLVIKRKYLNIED